MPRLVDHQQRRQQIADGAVKMAAEQGVDAVTLARVAEAAGVSKGMLQYYFCTRQDLIRSACQVINDRTIGCINAFVLSAEHRSPRERLLGILTCLIVPAEARKHDGLALRAFFVAAISDPELNLKYRQRRRALLELFETQLLMHWAREHSASDPQRAQEAARFVYGSLQEIGEAVALGEVAAASLPSELDRVVEHACKWPQIACPPRASDETA